MGTWKGKSTTISVAVRHAGSRQCKGLTGEHKDNQGDDRSPVFNAICVEFVRHLKFDFSAQSGIQLVEIYKMKIKCPAFPACAPMVTLYHLQHNHCWASAFNSPR